MWSHKQLFIFCETTSTMVRKMSIWIQLPTCHIYFLLLYGTATELLFCLRHRLESGWLCLTSRQIDRQNQIIIPPPSTLQNTEMHPSIQSSHGGRTTFFMPHLNIAIMDLSHFLSRVKPLHVKKHSPGYHPGCKYAMHAGSVCSTNRISLPHLAIH